LGLTKYGATNEAALNGLRWLEAILAAKDAQFAVVVPNELEFTKSLAAAIAEVRLAARACHVVAAGAALNVEL